MTPSSARSRAMWTDTPRLATAKFRSPEASPHPTACDGLAVPDCEQGRVVRSRVSVIECCGSFAGSLRCCCPGRAAAGSPNSENSCCVFHSSGAARPRFSRPPPAWLPAAARMSRARRSAGLPRTRNGLVRARCRSPGPDTATKRAGPVAQLRSRRSRTRRLPLPEPGWRLAPVRHCRAVRHELPKVHQRQACCAGLPAGQLLQAASDRALQHCARERGARRPDAGRIASSSLAAPLPPARAPEPPPARSILFQRSCGPGRVLFVPAPSVGRRMFAS